MLDFIVGYSCSQCAASFRVLLCQFEFKLGVGLPEDFFQHLLHPQLLVFLCALPQIESLSCLLSLSQEQTTVTCYSISVCLVVEVGEYPLLCLLCLSLSQALCGSVYLPAIGLGLGCIPAHPTIHQEQCEDGGCCCCNFPFSFVPSWQQVSLPFPQTFQGNPGEDLCFFCSGFCPPPPVLCCKGCFLSILILPFPIFFVSTQFSYGNEPAYRANSSYVRGSQKCRIVSAAHAQPLAIC